MPSTHTGLKAQNEFPETPACFALSQASERIMYRQGRPKKLSEVFRKVGNVSARQPPGSLRASGRTDLPDLDSHDALRR
jgi:hypothetical protein